MAIDNDEFEELEELSDELEPGKEEPVPQEDVEDLSEELSDLAEELEPEFEEEAEPELVAKELKEAAEAKAIAKKRLEEAELEEAKKKREVEKKERALKEAEQEKKRFEEKQEQRRKALEREEKAEKAVEKSRQELEQARKEQEQAEEDYYLEDTGDLEEIDRETRKEFERAKKKYEEGMRKYEEARVGDTSDLEDLAIETNADTPSHPVKKESKKFFWLGGTLAGLALIGGAVWFFLHKSTPVSPTPAAHSSSLKAEVKPKTPTLMDLVPAKLQAEFKPGEAHEDLGAVGAKDCYEFAALMATNKDYLQTQANMLKDKGPGVIQGNLKACSALVYRPKLIAALQKIRAQVLWQPRDGINTSPGFRQAYWRWLIAGTFVPGKTGSWDVKGCPAQIRYVLNQKGSQQVSGIISQTVADCLAMGAKAAPAAEAPPEAEPVAQEEVQQEPVDTATKKEEVAPEATTTKSISPPTTPKKPTVEPKAKKVETREAQAKKKSTVKPKHKKKQRPIAKKKAWQKKADDAMDAYFKQH